MKRKKHTRVVETQEVLVTCSTGTVVQCLPISNTLAAIRATVELPDVPTYQMTDVAGSVIDVEYDQAAIDDENTPEEDKTSWAEYQAKLAEATGERNNRIYARIVRKGVKVVSGLSMGKFIADLKEDGIEPPTDKKKLKRLYADLEIFACPDDFNQVLMGISLASGVDEEAIKAAEDQLFRPLGEPDGQDAGADPGDSETGQEQAA
jgi:hypothetical protein